MKGFRGTGALALATALAVAVPAQLCAEEPPKAAAAEKAPAIPPELIKLEKGLHPVSGDVRIPEAKAVLHLGENYYFLPAAEAKRVLVEAWGNPPSAGEGVLGMVFEKGTTIFDAVWGAVITYEDSGYVSDADAASQDYAQVLSDMQQGTEERNESRKAAGYPAMHLVGWAQPPSYDKASHSLIWARELKLDGATANELNYDVRLLGRSGVLSLNMLASMGSLDDVRGAAQNFGKSVSFEQGATYADYNASTDKTASYGLAGLVAGGAAVAAAKKLGLLGIILAFGKKFLILIPVVLGGIWAAIRRFFGGKPAEDEEG